MPVVGPLSISFKTLALVTAVAVAAAWPLPSRAGDAPEAVVESFHDALLEVMKKASALGVEGRYDHLLAPMRDAFDLKLSIRVAAGSHWRRADKATRQRLVDAFTRASVGSYASQFDGFSGEAFVTIGTKDGPHKTVLVSTHIVRPAKDPVKLTYVVRRAAKNWRIVDVLLDNDISQLAIRRSEYSRLLTTSGVDGLIASLNEKADSLIAP